MNKAAVIFYHSNIQALYKPQWIQQCIQSIKEQSFKQFDVYELNYGTCGTQLCNSFSGKKYTFIHKPFQNHIQAMNHLIDRVFADGYQVVFNTNMDDHYHYDRFLLQMQKISEGCHLVSSDFCYITEGPEGQDTVDLHLDMAQYADIQEQLDSNHNIVAHPCVAMHKSFWTKGLRYNEQLLGSEDLDLWQRAVKAGKKISIIPHCLLYYRIHPQQVTKAYPAVAKE